MIVTLVDKRLIWFLFPGRKEVSMKGSLLEGGRVICFVNSRRGAEKAKKILSVTSDSFVIVCKEIGEGIDLSKWSLVYTYMTEVLHFKKKAKVQKVFDGAVDDESIEFALQFVGEASALKKWPEHLVKKRMRVFQLCEAVASGSDSEALKEFFKVDDPSLVLGIVAKMCARAQGSEKQGSDWAMKVAKHAKQTCDMSVRTLRILLEDRFTERFQSLAFIMALLGNLK